MYYMERKETNLSSFLNSHRVTDKATKPTHTGMSQMMGKYIVQQDERDSFFDLYTKSLGKGELLYLTEVHEDKGPIVIDIDMRFPIDHGLKRQYSESDIEKVIRAYHTQIRHFLKIEEKDIVAFVFEKPTPSKCLGNIKDGVHIMYPYIICNADIQYAIRENVIVSFADSEVFKHLGLKNTLDDVFDIAVVSRNNWLLYGSGKDDSPRYKLSMIFDSSVNRMKTLVKDKELPKLLSIQGKGHLAQEIKNMPKVINSSNTNKQRTTISEAINIASNKDIDMVKGLLPLLSRERCNRYHEWIEVGFCLHNIDSSLLGVWTDWSRQSGKFKSGECETYWSKFKNDGLSIASLYRWAKIDSPESYTSLKRTEVSQCLMDSLSCTNVDVANAVYALYKHEYVCASLKGNDWYQFTEHRWRKVDKGFTLRQNISTKLAQEYIKLNSYYKKMTFDTVESEKLEEYKKKIKKCDEAIKLVKTTTFKDQVMRECAELFYDSQFYNRTDSKLHILSFENGIYDLNQSIFRDGLPDDYCTLSCGINYIEYNKNCPVVKEIMSLIECILPQQEERTYTLKLLGSFLSGSTGDQKFHIWTGTGANGKSTIVELFENSFGEYCCKLPITVLTQKRGSSSGATPEISRTKGKRFVSMQEPDQESKINVGYMKELSGGDKISARGLFSDMVEFKPQFKMILCCNKLPGVPSNDGGTWRRLRVLDFPSKFVDSPTEPNEYKKDSTIAEKSKNWGSYFISILLQYYERYKKEGLKEPESVLHHTREYQKKSDMILDFIEETLEYTGCEKDTIQISELYSLCKVWFTDTLSDKSPNKKDFTEYLNAKFGPETSKRGLKKYKLIITDNCTL